MKSNFQSNEALFPSFFPKINTLTPNLFLFVPKLSRSVSVYSKRNIPIDKKMLISSNLGGEWPFLSMKTVIVSIIITSMLLEGCQSAVTYAPGPSINYTYIDGLDNSSIGHKYISSKRIENLVIYQNGGTLGFLIRFFNRSESGLFTEYALNGQVGNWSHIISTKNTLSCNILYQTDSKSIGFLKFNSTNTSLSLYAKVDITMVKGNLTAPYSSMGDVALLAQITPAESCDTFSINGSLFQVTPGLTATISRITVPTGWRANNYVESFKYGVTDSKLYRFNSISSQYDTIYTFDKFATWKIFEYNGRIIATGANASVLNATFNSFVQKIYILTDSAAGPILIKVISLTGTSDDQNIIPIYTSPRLTKIFYWILPAGSTPPMVVNAKSVDYNDKLVVDMIVDDSPHFQATFDGILPTEFDIGDYALVVRNGSKNSSAVQQAYQYLGKRIILIAARPLITVNEFTKWFSILIDSSLPYTIVCINSYYGNGNINIWESRFGNLADRRRIIPSVTRPYISFTKGSGGESTDWNRLVWLFLDAGTNTTKFMIITHAYSNINHYESFTTTLNGLYAVMATAPYCSIYFKLTQQKLFLAKYNSSAATPFNMINLDSQTAATGQTLDEYDTWYLSADCKRFSVRGYTFSEINGTFVMSTENVTNFLWQAVDSSLSYAIFSNMVWKYNSATNKYIPYLNTTLYSYSQKIYSYNNMVVIIACNQSYYDSYSTNYIAQQIFAYIDNGTALLPVFSYDVVWGSLPIIEISDKLTKIVIFALMGNKTAVSAFSIDYNNKANTTISFPMEGVEISPNDTRVKISQKFIYVRQIYSSDTANINPNYTSINRQEFAYYLNGTTTQLFFKNNLTLEQANNYRKALLLSDDNGSTYYLAVESAETYIGNASIVVRTTSLDLNPNQNTSNEQIIVCNPGCAQCSTQTCTSCLSGFVFKSSSAQCIPCGSSCIACNVHTPQSCTSCLIGNYLNGNKCNPCNASCLSCAQASTCLTCKPGYFFDPTPAKCNPCKRNCETCTSSTTCTQCKKGFVIANGNQCRGCSMSCSDCDPNNITACTACSKGLQLLNSACVSCPDNCIECANSQCTKCVPGYTVDAAEGDCHLSCQAPCATCEEGRPTVCKSCEASAVLNSGKCTFSHSCNSTGNCTNCGNALGVFLLDLYCLTCTQLGKIPNCVQCSQLNPLVCSICENGYYVDQLGSCSSCPDNCITCLSNIVCTSCFQGSTLRTDQFKGKCFACESPCLTCYGSPVHCLSCIAGFSKEGWKCLNDTHIDLRLTLSGTVSGVLSSIDSVVVSILTMIGENATNVDCVTFVTIVSGSVVITAVTSPIAIPVATASVNLQTALAGGATVGGLTVTASSVAIDTGTSSSSSQQDPKIHLIIGVAIGAFFLVVIIVVTIILCLKKHQRKTVGNMGSHKKSERQITIVEEIDLSKNGLEPTNSNSKINLK